ncbi:Fic family protein [Paraglaciecola sp.]|uniref:Fic family protein n=1 Tax=Paraglaciecola sp. TaxID=1920173 RepID=UPI0030F419AD
MPSSYQPPCSITPSIIRLIVEVSESLGRMSVLQAVDNLRLRRINRIRTIQGSLAIEGNTLSEQQITAIFEGKHVIAPAKEIQEARNAIKAYEQFTGLHAENEQDLFLAHRILMTGLIDEAGVYRSGNVGVMKGEQVLHMAPPANRVPKLMADLLAWIASSDQHPLISSSVFHYEFEFIHPFADGNGRMGRLWQTLILSRWNSLLVQLPIESMVHSHQDDYYQAINKSTQLSDAAPFVEFMLSTILQTIESNIQSNSPQVNPQPTPQVNRLLKALAAVKSAMNREELQQALKLKDRKSFRERYLKPALEAELIEMTIPDKPNSPLQRYQLKKS